MNIFTNGFSHPRLVAVCAFMLCAVPFFTHATSVHLQVVAPSATLFNDAVDVSACPVTTDVATSTISAKCALEQAGLTPVWSAFGDNYFLDSINGHANDSGASAYWNWWSDLEYGSIALNKHELAENESLLIALGVFPLKLEVANASLADGETTGITVSEFGFDSGFNAVWTPSSGAVVDFGWGATTTDAAGEVTVEATSTLPFAVAATKTGFVGATAAITPQTAHVQVRIRDGATLLSFDSIALANANAADSSLSPTGSTTAIAIPARSLAAVLASLDSSEVSFDISQLDYFYSFGGSFYINCIVLGSSAPSCDNWRYVVNGADPFLGIDHVLLKNGDTAVVYFGFPREVSLSAAAITTGESITATAETYDPLTNTSSPASGVTIGVTQPNPSDPFNPTEIQTGITDGGGQAVFTVNTAGTYDIGIKEDFYFPTTPLLVSDPAPVGAGGGGGGGSTPTFQFDVAKALAYLTSKQHADGSFDSALLTDWAALAFAASDPGAPKTLLRNYLLSATPLLSSATDYERHAMALLSLGINPYSDTPTNYIAEITNRFDGTQIGDAHLDNDDIFALFPLLHAGYGTGDDIIQKTVAFILSAQNPNGAWDASVDMTAAAVQALSHVPSLSGVPAALAKAESYLRSQQKQDGGFGNSFSTSWSLQAIAALNQSAANWAPGGISPNSYLALLQQPDGGLGPLSADTQTRQWGTEYAIPAVLGKTWGSLLSAFGKPAGTSGSGSVLGASASNSTASSTLIAATSTPPAATSTPPQIATSTPLIEPAQSTTTPSTNPGQPAPKLKTVQPKAAPATKTALPPQPVATSSPSSQIAAAAESLPKKSFLGAVWNSILSFFANLF